MSEKFRFRVTIYNCQGQLLNKIQNNNRNNLQLTATVKNLQLPMSIYQQQQQSTTVKATPLYCNYRLSFQFGELCTFVELQKQNILQSNWRQMHWAAKVVHHVVVNGRLLFYIQIPKNACAQVLLTKTYTSRFVGQFCVYSSHDR